MKNIIDFYHKNEKKLVKILVVLGIIIFIVRPILLGIIFSHKLVKDYNRYLWVLNDSIELGIPNDGTGVDTFLCSTGRVRKGSSYFNYNLAERKWVHIFEYEDLNNMNINSIYFCESVGNKTFNLGNASEFNSEIEGWPVVKIKTFLDFNNDLKVFYPESQELSLFSESENYKAFIGDADYIALTNGLWKPQVIYEFDKINNYILVFYKANFKLLIIVIHSDGLIEKKRLEFTKTKIVVKPFIRGVGRSV